MEDKSVLEIDRDLKFPHVFVLNASAGSGKTHSLSLRFIQFLLSNRIKNASSKNILNNMLAITFTNKAANEMKERILRQMKRIAIGDEGALSDAQSVISLDKETLQKSSHRLTDEIIRHYTDFQVRTIDSFLRSIVVASLRETNLQPDFDIAMDPAPYLEYAVDDLLSRIRTDPSAKRIFLMFLDIYMNVEGKTSFYPRRDIIKTVSRLRYQENKKGKHIESTLITLDELHKKKDRLKEGINNLYDSIDANHLEVNTRNLPGTDVLIDRIDNDIFSNQLWLEPDIGYILKKQSRHLKDILQHTWDTTRELLADFLITSGSGRYSAYHDILKHIEKTLEEITRTRGEILIDDINKQVRMLIDKYNVPELYFNLGESILHYFIDEFQDTDRAQWNNIKALVIEALANGGSLFYVGDRKQSIYRFKGSDSSLFDEVIHDEEINPILKETYARQLGSNYRSTAFLVDFFNETFRPDHLKRMFIDEEDPIKSRINTQIKQLIDTVYRDSSQTTPKNDAFQKRGGYILVECNKPGGDPSHDGTKDPDDNNDMDLQKDEDAGTKRINEIIADLHNRGITYSDIAILVRKNEQVKTFSGKLKQNRIPVQSAQGFDIREHPLIREVLSFLNFLNNPLDNLSFAGFISGEIFRKISGIRTNDMHDWLLQQRGTRSLYAAFKKWQSVLWNELISPLLNGVGYLPAYDIVHEFIERFKIHDNFDASMGFFMHILGMLKIREDGGDNNLDSFLEYWIAAKEDDPGFFVNLSSSDAVKILTIHKSKGLEFPVVILPSASLRSQGNGKQSMLMIEAPDKLTLSYTSKAHRTILNSIHEADPSVGAYINDNALSFMDELNAFYVAVTRARQELYIFIQDEKDPLYMLFENKLGSTGRYEQGVHIVSEKRQKEEEHVFPAKAAASTRWQHHIFIKQPDRDSLENYNEEKRGDIIHEILSKVTTVDDNLREKIMELLSTIKDETIGNRSDLPDVLMEAITRKDTKSWFDPGPSAGVFTEKEVVNKQGQTKRIDRLVVTRDEAVIIDYKTGGLKDIDKHKKQVKEYMDIISDIYPAKQVKGYLLYIDHKMLEEVG
jgi:ATP-dependent exoDNAse (exonuclease V) beta subunit